MAQLDRQMDAGDFSLSGHRANNNDDGDDQAEYYQLGIYSTGT